MRAALYVVTIAIALSFNLHANDKGNCPPTPPSSPARPAAKPAPIADKTFVGTVSLITVVSDKGYVCSAKVVRGVNKTADTDATTKVKAWKFSPALKDGHPVPVVVQVDVHYWRDKDGQLVSSPTEAPAAKTE